MTRAHVITGSFGAGKTTAISRLMAGKPEHELWIVILNEFTEAGIDALCVAQSARGSYDLRLVAGGCLCCVGELEFEKQLRDILRNFKPARLLIEPSGAGHAADIVDTLAVYEKQKALNLDGVICLVDPQDAVRILEARPYNEWSQIQSADVLLLSKPDIAGDAELNAFDAIAAAQFPMKQFLGTCSRGEMPVEAMQQFERAPRFSLLPSRGGSEAAVTSDFSIAGELAVEALGQQLGFWTVLWILPPELSFARSLIEPRLQWMLQAYAGWLRRLKAVFRTGPGPSWLVQSSGHGMACEDSAFRRDSRVEMVLNAAPTPEFLDAWRDLLRQAANPPRAAEPFNHGS